MQKKYNSFSRVIWKRYTKQIFGVLALIVLLIFFLVGVYAPLLASSKPLIVNYHGTWYFPLFRYLFYMGYYSKKIDIFFNLLMFTLPLFIISLYFQKKKILVLLIILQFGLFTFFSLGVVKNPAADPKLNKEHQRIVQEYLVKYHHSPLPDWNFSLDFKNEYSKLNTVLNFIQSKEQNERLKSFEEAFRQGTMEKWTKRAIKEKRASLLRQGVEQSQLPTDEELRKLVLESVPVEIITRADSMPTLYKINQNHNIDKLKQLNKTLLFLEKENKTDTEEYRYAKARKDYLIDKAEWIESETQAISFKIMPLLRSFHWEDDAGGEQELNKYVSWWELTRINRKDMLAALIFGVRVSLVVGIAAVAISLAIGIPIGSFAGYYGGKFDIITCRLLEVWEAMPILFMLLFIVAITQTKSILMIVVVIGIFGWTSFSRFLRGEFFKQRNLAYVESCKASGFNDLYIMFSHVLPNAIPPLLTLLPFAVMGAITSEAALSFLGLGEEGSCSWGVLMDEGRTAFPGESYLLWPPAILLTLLLISIALVGDALRDALDPKS